MNKSGLTDLAMVLVALFALVATGCSSSDGILGVNEGRVRFVLSSGGDTGAEGPALAPSLHGGEDDDDGRRFL